MHFYARSATPLHNKKNIKLIKTTYLYKIKSLAQEIAVTGDFFVSKNGIINVDKKFIVRRRKWITTKCVIGVSASVLANTNLSPTRCSTLIATSSIRCTQGLEDSRSTKRNATPTLKGVSRDLLLSGTRVLQRQVHQARQRGLLRNLRKEICRKRTQRPASDEHQKEQLWAERKHGIVRMGGVKESTPSTLKTGGITTWPLVAGSEETKGATCFSSTRWGTSSGTGCSPTWPLTKSSISSRESNGQRKPKSPSY